MKQTEVGLIPDDWEVKTLIEIGYFIGGGTPNTNIPSYWKGTIPWVSSSDIKKDSITSLIPTRFITQEAINNSATKLCPPDTLLIVSRVGVGKLAIAEEEVCTSQDFSNFVCTKQNVKFIAYELLQKMQKKAEEAQGTSIKGITTEEIKLLKIPLPPLAEQHRIAKALSDVDAVISTTEKLIQKKKDIKQGAMQSLLTGKKRLPSFAAASKFKQTELGEIPEDWEVKTFGDYASIMRGGSPRPIQNYLTTNSDGINWIKIGDVKPEDKYIVATEEKIIPEGKSRSREVHKGDFILSNSMSFGRPYILQIDGCIHDGWLAIQNYQETFDTDFLYYLLGFDEIFEQYIEMAAGSSVQNLNKEKVAKLLVPIFDKKEQTAIANVLSSMDKEIETLKTKLEKYRNLKTAMMQQLLTGKIRLY